MNSIEPIKRRFYWPHPYYIEAVLHGHACARGRRWWQMYVDVTVGYRYIAGATS